MPTLLEPPPPPVLKTPEPPLVARLGIKLRQVAGELRAARLHRDSIVRWAGVTGVLLVLLGVRIAVPELAGFMFAAMGVVFLGAMWLGLLASRRGQYDFVAAAQVVENEYPELRQALRTAVEQLPDAAGQYHFLQLRVIGSAVHHGWRHDWLREPRRRTRRYLAGHVAMVAVAVVVGALVLIQGGPLLPWAPAPAAPLPGLSAEIAVTPGDSEVERGSAVIVAARFNKKLPRQAELVWRTADGKTGRGLMSRHLSDPVYVFTLPNVGTDTTYQVLFEGRQTDEYTLTVFDYPALVRADAALDYPEYTGLADRVIRNTRRVSAIAGTGVKYEFNTNKPLRGASLVDAAGQIVPLAPANPERTLFTTAFTLNESKRFSLRLEDERGRVNPAPVDIRLEALENKRPVVRMTFPRRDRRVSALEEMPVAAEAREDFGLLDYGFAFSVGAEEPQFVSLRPDKTGQAPVQAAFNSLYALEPHGVEPEQLVTWIAWADDFGPDGQPRRTTTDLYFAEVRPFEEIYREANNAEVERQQQQQQQPGQRGGGGQNEPQQELIDLQRDISVALWKLRQLDKPGRDFAADLTGLGEGQARAQEMLAEQRERFTAPRQQAAVADAERYMKQSADGLAEAGEKASLAPLVSAWQGANGAYQALLRLQARNFNVGQTRQQGGQRGQSQNQRNQQQLNQLRFRQEQNRYQTESEAQSQQPLSPEQRQQLEVQSRLRDLARRQQDVNERVRELQTALNAANDEQQRDEIRRELRRLEEEQRQMLADLDETRQQLDNLQAGDQTQQARQQLEQAREDMQRASERLERGELAQAAAAGARTREQLEATRENLQRDSSSVFSEQMREARRVARELEQRQLDADRQLAQMDAATQRSLDDSAPRQAIAEGLEQQRRDLATLNDNLRQITEDSETTEPNLYRQLYDLLRQQGQANTAQQLQNGAELLRRGFVEQSREAQNGVARNLQQLRQGVERAASSILGDEAQELRFAQSELDSLMRELQREQPATEQTNPEGQAQAGQPGQGQRGQRGPGQNTPGKNGQARQPGEGQEVAANNPSEQNGEAGAQPAGGRQGQGQGPGQRGTGQRGGPQPGQGEGAEGIAAGEPNGRSGGRGSMSEDFRGQDPQAAGENQLAQDRSQPAGGQQGQGAGQRRGQGGSQGGTSEDFRDQEQPDGAGQVAQQGGRQGGAGQRQGRGAGQAQGQELQAQDGSGQGQRQGQGAGRGQGEAQGPGQGQGAGEGQDGAQLAQNEAGQAGGQGGRGQRQPGRGAGQRQGRGGPGEGQGAGGADGQAQDEAAQDQLALTEAEAQPGEGQSGRGQGRQGGARLGGGRRGGLDGGGQVAQNNRRGGTRAGGGGGGNGAYDGLDDLLGNYWGGDYVGGPLTGENYGEWVDRLRTVENLIEQPDLRQQVATARNRAEDFRREWQRRGAPPRWGDVQSSVMAPLSAVRLQLAQELARREQPESLLPADRDPVPDKFADSVRSYYEALSAQ